MDAFGRNRVVPDGLKAVSKIVNVSTFSEKAGDQSKTHWSRQSSEIISFTMVP